jgi:hypothetical protein
MPVATTRLARRWRRGSWRAPRAAYFGSAKSLKSCAPLNERLLAEIAAVQFKHIEAIDACRHMPAVQQGEEVGLAVTACGNQLAIDDAGFCREPEDGRGDPLEPAAQIAAILAVDVGGDTHFVETAPASRQISVRTASRRRSAARIEAWPRREG